MKDIKNLILFFCSSLILFSCGSEEEKQTSRKLPIYGERDNDEKGDTIYHTVGNFSLKNQEGDIYSHNDLEGKIYVADFFFTTCGSICPIMTTNMVEIQKTFLHNNKVKLLSHSVLPDIDEVPILKNYAKKNGVIDSKWNLVTGDKKEIYRMARKSYLAVKLGKPEELYDMVHTENFVLVDTKRRVRGFYDGTKKEEIQRLIEDINWLCNEQ